MTIVDKGDKKVICEVTSYSDGSELIKNSKPMDKKEFKEYIQNLISEQNSKKANLEKTIKMKQSQLKNVSEKISSLSKYLVVIMLMLFSHMAYSQILPVRLLSYEIDGSDLVWTVDSEINHDRYEVYGTDDFKEIVDLSEGIISVDKISYRKHKVKVDEYLFTYMVQVDLDGEKTKFDILTTGKEVEEFEYVYSNGLLTSNKQYSVYDIQGRLLFEGSNRYEIPQENKLYILVSDRGSVTYFK